MTGWRIGWLVGRRDIGEKAAQLNEYIISHAPSFVQRAAQTALMHGEEELKRMLVRLKEKSRLLSRRPPPDARSDHSFSRWCILPIPKD